MRRFVITATLLSLCMSLPTSLAAHRTKRYLTKESTVDMKNKDHVFVGWVDFSPDVWMFYRHKTASSWTTGDPFSKAEWTDAIGSLNSVFQTDLRSRYLPGRTVTAAKGRDDENAAGNDLYIKFSDVRIDYDNYQLFLSIHFIDPKTQSEIGSIPARPYYGDASGILEYLMAALDEVATKLRVEVTGETAGKKQK